MKLPAAGALRLRNATLIAAVALSPIVACEGTGKGAGDRTGLTGTLVVFAAASLTDAFGDLAAAFEELHPEVDIQLNLAGSSTLREQILEGAPADVFAPADQANMSVVVEAGETAGAPAVLAGNEMQIAVAPGNPGGVTGLANFADASLLIGLCAEGVPCGDLARQVLDAAGVIPALDTNEPDVRALLAKVELGELDTAIVYRTDVIAAGNRVAGIDIPPDDNVLARYPIAVLADAPNPVAARRFTDFVTSDAGRTVLVSHGFLSP